MWGIEGVASQALWLATLSPGLVALAFLRPSAPERGALASLSLAFAVSTALAAPLFLAAYVLGASVAAVSFAWLVGTAVALAVCAVGLVGGGYATHDVPMHAAKVLAIREQGFGLQDPYSPLAVWETKHMVNAIHAIHAVLSWLAGQRPLEFLHASAWFVMLLIVSAAEFLAASLFSSLRAGRVALLAAGPLALSRELVLLQNNVASFAVFPLMLGLAWTWLRRGRRGDLVLLATCSLALGIVHTAVAALAGLLLVPLVLLSPFLGAGLRPGILRRGLWAAAALLPAWPPVLFTALQPDHFRAQLGSVRDSLVVEAQAFGVRFWTLDPRPYLWMPLAILALAATAVAWPRGRRQVVWLGAVLVLAFSWMFHPGRLAVLDVFVPADGDWIRRAELRAELLAPGTPPERRREICRQEASTSSSSTPGWNARPPRGPRRPRVVRGLARGRATRRPRRAARRARGRLLTAAPEALRPGPRVAGAPRPAGSRLAAVSASAAASAWRRLPAHGRAGLGLVAVAWALNWGLDGLRTHVLFFPLWLGYALALDGIAFARRGTSAWARHPRSFALLYPLSVPLWWGFELVNERLENWEYLGEDRFGPVSYFLLSSVSFSTVVPAIVVSAELVRGTRWIERFARGPRFRPGPGFGAVCVAVGLAMGAAMLLWPRQCYAFEWTFGVFLLEPLCVRLGRRSFLADLARGDWRDWMALWVGALLCGFFWELWNFWSWPKWVYHVPYVGFGKVFEMPALGFLGYLPFAMVICQVVRLAFRRPPFVALGSGAPPG